MHGSGEVVPVRRAARTQAERSSATKNRLLRATVDCLLELGFTGTTTKAVESRAGVTRGALLHHYPSKLDLFLATVEYMHEVWAERLRTNALTVDPDEGVEALLGLMWGHFTDPMFYASLELIVAARTDPVLLEAMTNRHRSSVRDVRAVAAELFGVPADDPSFVTGMNLCLRFMRGSAVAAILSDGDAAHQKAIEEWRHLVLPYFLAARRHNRQPAQADGSATAEAV